MTPCPSHPTSVVAALNLPADAGGAAAAAAATSSALLMEEDGAPFAAGGGAIPHAVPRSAPHPRSWRRIDELVRAKSMAPLLPGTLLPQYSDDLTPTLLAGDLLREAGEVASQPALAPALARGVASMLEGAHDRAARFGHDAVRTYHSGVELLAGCGFLPGYRVGSVEELRTGPNPSDYLLDDGERWLNVTGVARGKGGRRVQKKQLHPRVSAKARLRARLEREAEEEVGGGVELGGDDDPDRAVTMLPEETLAELLAAVSEGDE